MRYQNEAKALICLQETKLFVAGVMVLTLLSSAAIAKTTKYDRPKATASTSDASAAPADKTAAPGSSKSGAPAAGGEKKVDLSDLENRYWTAKDTEFNVVQNRLYTKTHKFSIAPVFGTSLSSVYTSDYNLGLSLNYYFSEREGLQLDIWKTSSTDATYTTDLATKGAYPDHNMKSGFVGVNYIWVPIYAKLSLLEKKILYFDMFVAPGLGATFLSSGTFSTTVTNTTAVTSTPITLALDVGQQVFLSEHWALRADLKNHFYQETIYKADTGANLRTKGTYDGILMFGVTFFQ